jgi:hypothetical protein
MKNWKDGWVRGERIGGDGGGQGRTYFARRIGDL